MMDWMLGKMGYCEDCQGTGIQSWIDDYAEPWIPIVAQDWCGCWRGWIKREMSQGVRFLRWSYYGSIARRISLRRKENPPDWKEDEIPF